VIFQKDCPVKPCNFSTTESRELRVMDQEFQAHMQTAHLDDGEYEAYLVNDLGVDTIDAEQTISDLKTRRENPPDGS
jgi:hypothetical protein